MPNVVKYAIMTSQRQLGVRVGHYDKVRINTDMTVPMDTLRFVEIIRFREGFVAQQGVFGLRKSYFLVTKMHNSIKQMHFHEIVF